MSDRVFAKELAEWNGARKMCWLIICQDCQKRSHYGANTARMPNPIMATSHFRHAGWKVASNWRGDLCPQCQQKKPTTAQVIQMKPSPSEQPPRQMGRDDKRIVFAKIDEVYLGQRLRCRLER